MMKTKDEEINKILDRAEEYRKQFQKKESHVEAISFNDDLDFGEIFDEFFKLHNKLNYDDKNNVFIKCKLTKENLKNGCTKIIKYKSIDKNNKRISKKIEVKFPKQLSVGQKVIIAGCGNYIKENNAYSNLVITVEGKLRRTL